MAACVVCERPVVLDAVLLSDGQLCHIACRHRPRAEPRASRVQKVTLEQTDRLFEELRKRSA